MARILFQTKRHAPAKRTNFAPAARLVFRRYLQPLRICMPRLYNWSMANTSEFRTGRHCVFALHVHLVFVTKYRRKVLTEAVHETLRDLFARLCQEFEARLVE